MQGGFKDEGVVPVAMHLEETRFLQASRAHKSCPRDVSICACHQGLPACRPMVTCSDHRVHFVPPLSSLLCHAAHVMCLCCAALCFAQKPMLMASAVMHCAGGDCLPERQDQAARGCSAGVLTAPGVLFPQFHEADHESLQLRHTHCCTCSGSTSISLFADLPCPRTTPLMLSCRSGCSAS